ncbi:hypothetical protein ABID22_003879 [Pontibacter aydingkolensis]|uniref:Amidoligase family protein n=1 Tax=Pontibacter aydingkolensis TaxID=1911536 RepID=A0ABS7CZ67_9BACT|nr:amidoligase family protein [Pontibacter aydingkolensis]MBW7469163.1 amidoligase family protein [Pontibacter aydingkolensis]
MQFKQPPVLYNEDGKIRTVGFELEYANLGIEESVQLVQHLYGGSVQRENRFRQQVVGTRLGDFTIEFDLTLLTEKLYKKPFESLNIRIEDVKLGEGTLEDEVETALESIIGKLFPYEIACPPVPCTELWQLEKLREALYQHHAEDTDSFPTNAFGTHINIETPDTHLDTLLAYMRAFLLLYPWLVKEGDIDLARKLSPFIRPYPNDYAELILRPDYQPTLEQLIQDYHTYNPDRNRPLDMYPIFAALHPEFLHQFKGMGKVKARKTYHYRLPNSCVAQPDWTLAQEWNNWVAVEELASDRERLNELCYDYVAMKNDGFIGFETKWLKKINQWLS